VGAGLAGCAAALHLTRSGHDVTVVDAITEPYSGGYMLQLDQNAQHHLKELDLWDLMEKLSAPAPMIDVVRTGARGHKQVTTLDPRGYRLVRRGELIGGIGERTAAETTLQLGRELVGIEQRLERVVAHFADGAAERYDLLIGADGVRSTVRRLVLGPDDAFVYDNGWTNVWVNVPIDLLGPDRSEIYYGKGIGAYFFPYPEGEQALFLAFMPTGSRPTSTEELLAQARRSMESVRRSSGVSSADTSDRGSAIAAALSATDPAMVRRTRFAQTRMGRWHAGRVVLLGDAAYCVDPMSGVGTTASLVGAQHLSQALSAHGADVDAAARSYTAAVAPRVRLWQHTTAGLLESLTAAGGAHRLHGAGELARVVAGLVPAYLSKR
jgi:2-polyprenyl-6-methoxyphenol hydroxylase-like FAD-dependent oxidoreductase